jgi:hypothetical protein
MLNSKDMSNNSPIPKSDKSDSGSSKDFDFYGFTNPFVYYFTVSVIMSVSLVVSSYGIELYNYSLQAQNWIMVGHVVGVVWLLVQALFLSVFVRVGYFRKNDLSV